MSYLGEYQIDEVLTFYVNTHAPATGAGTDADAVPPYRVYEEETTTAILTGNTAKLDDSNTVGFYSEQITLSAANGLEVGKRYAIYISATVGGVVGTTHHTFQMRAAPALASAILDAAGIRTAVGLATANLDTQLGDLPTNAELATSQAAADDATLAAIAALNNLSAAQVNAEVDTAIADVGLTTTITGRIDAAITTRASQTSVDDLPTNAELATSQAAADDATLAAIAAVDAKIDTIDNLIDTEVGTLITNVAAILADTGTDGVVVAAGSKAGYALSATGLDAIPITAPAGPATTFREALVQTWRRYFKKSVLNVDDGLILTYADNGSTVITTQVVADDGTEQTVNAAT